MANMIGRKVRCPWNKNGTVTRWEPLSSGMCDALVLHGDGSECWYASHTLKPTDGQGELPSRSTAVEVATAQARTQLQEIRTGLVSDWRKPWPGMEHGKAILGKALDNAILELGGANKGR